MGGWKKKLLHLIAGLSVLASGCRGLGPRTVPNDRFNYNQAGAQSSSEQLLLNIVRMRYGEPTYWLEITNMLSQYELRGAGALSWFDYTLVPLRNPALRAVYGLDPDPALNKEQEANLSFTDRPTITYAPLQGKEFSTQLMAPIPPATVIFLAESGWPIDRVLDCCVQRINGVPNTPIHDVESCETFDAKPFNRIATLLRELQDCGALRFALEYDAKEKTAYLQGQPDAAKETEAGRELRQALGLEQRHQRLKLLNKPDRDSDDELAVQTRSLLATMSALSASFEAPAEHITSGQALPGASPDRNAAAKWLTIKHSRLPVSDAFVQVKHNGYWFYIPRGDYRSKRTFALLIYLFSLQTATASSSGPLLTVPTGG